MSNENKVNLSLAERMIEVARAEGRSEGQRAGRQLAMAEMCHEWNGITLLWTPPQESGYGDRTHRGMILGATDREQALDILEATGHYPREEGQGQWTCHCEHDCCGHWSTPIYQVDEVFTDEDDDPIYLVRASLAQNV